MRKRILTILVAVTFVFTMFTVNLKADGVIMGETIVYLYNNISDLPQQFVKGSEMATYEYGGEEVYDFRDYFVVYDNTITILDMHSLEEGIDKGGYVWNTDFDIDVAGVYEIELSYEGVTGHKSNSVELEVVEEDIEAPEIFMQDGKFNKTREENVADFEREFASFLNRIRVYDKVDGIIEITKDDFDEELIESLRVAPLHATVEVTLTVVDEAGNEGSKTVTLSVVDSRAPNIQNVKTITTRKGKRINYVNHLVFVDNYSDREDIVVNYDIYETLVRMNDWQTGDKRPTQSSGSLISSLLRFEDDGYDSYIRYLAKEFKTGYLTGDYFEVIDEGVENYFVIDSKEEVLIDGVNVEVNKWTHVTDKKELKGKRLRLFYSTNMNQSNFLEYVKEEYETGFEDNDYYDVLDLKEDSKYFVYIAKKDDDLRDRIETIDFNKIGVNYVNVEAIDEFGNDATVNFRVVVENGISLFMTVLIINGIALAVVGGAGLIIFLTRRYQKAGEHEGDE